MREIKLTIQKNEDVILIMQGLNWIRKHIIDQMKLEISITDYLKNKGIDKDFVNFEEHSDANDRIMSMIAQLDKIVEGKVK